MSVFEGVGSRGDTITAAWPMGGRVPFQGETDT